MKASLPNIIDTKLMANTPPLKEDIIGSTLEELVKIMDQGPFKLPKLANGLDHPSNCLKMKIDINQVILTRCLAY